MSIKIEGTMEKLFRGIENERNRREELLLMIGSLGTKTPLNSFLQEEVKLAKEGNLNVVVEYVGDNPSDNDSERVFGLIIKSNQSGSERLALTETGIVWQWTNGEKAVFTRFEDKNFTDIFAGDHVLNSCSKREFEDEICDVFEGVTQRIVHGENNLGMNKMDIAIKKIDQMLFDSDFDRFEQNVVIKNIVDKIISLREGEKALSPEDADFYRRINKDLFNRL